MLTEGRKHRRANTYTPPPTHTHTNTLKLRLARWLNNRLTRTLYDNSCNYRERTIPDIVL